MSAFCTAFGPMLLLFSPFITLKEQKSAYLGTAILSLKQHLNVKTKADTEQLLSPKSR